MDKQSSDERLLKLIEGQYGSGNRGGQQVILPQGQKPAGKKIQKKLNLTELLSRAKLLKVDLGYINKGLVLVAIFLTLVFLFALFTPPSSSGSSVGVFSSTDTLQIQRLINAGQEQAGIRKSISFQDIKRNIFLPFGSPQGAFNSQEGADLSEELKALKLVGIIWSANPEVMIENEKDSRTYILKKGDTFNEVYKIKNITRNSVTLQLSTQDGLKDYELR
ncbi:MAG: hypothetical protein JXL82_04755 [Candidatus Omnitrophica bacterium]|nr:hypothetical protein [Candidatus Omnitrophota bacterium]